MFELVAFCGSVSSSFFAINHSGKLPLSTLASAQKQQACMGQLQDLQIEYTCIFGVEWNQHSKLMIHRRCTFLIQGEAQRRRVGFISALP